MTRNNHAKRLLAKYMKKKRLSFSRKHICYVFSLKASVSWWQRLKVHFIWKMSSITVGASYSWTATPTERISHSLIEHLFSPLGKLAGRAIYFTCVNFFLFFNWAKLSQDLLDRFSRSFHQMEGICVNVDYPVHFFPIPQGTLPWQPILCTKKNTNHARFLQFLHHMKAFLV